jgi:Helix-turn-helix domain
MRMATAAQHPDSLSAKIDAGMPGAAIYRCAPAAAPWESGDAPAPPGPRLLTLAEAAELVPLSEKTLRRVATRDAREGGPSSPFRKVERRWMVYEDELHDWIREHPASRKSAAEPSRRPRPRRRGVGMRARVMESAE